MLDKSKTAAERKRQERERKHAMGLVRYEIWIKPEHKQLVSEYAASLIESKKCDQCEYGDNGNSDPTEVCSICHADSEYTPIK